jgi:hypothetical protein
MKAETVYLTRGQLDNFFGTYSNAEFASFAPFSIEKDLRHFYTPPAMVSAEYRNLNTPARCLSSGFSTLNLEFMDSGKKY